MKKLLILALILMMPLTSCTAEQPAAPAPAQAPPPPAIAAAPVPEPGAQLTAFFGRLKAGEKQTVVAYGTSLTRYGHWVKAMEDYFDGAYPGLVTVVNSGGPGQGSTWGLTNVRALVLDKNPDLVLMEFSYNDAHARLKTPLPKSRENLVRMVEAIRAAKPRTAIVLQTMNLPWDKGKGAAATDRPQLQEYYDVYRTFAREQKLPLLDHSVAWNSLLTTNKANYENLVPDGSHPARMGSLLVTWAGVKALFDKAGGPNSGGRQ